VTSLLDAAHDVVTAAQPQLGRPAPHLGRLQPNKVPLLKPKTAPPLREAVGAVL
jgi:hypothetical protein